MWAFKLQKSTQHPKAIQVFQSFLQGKLGLESIDIIFHLYYLIFPFSTEQFEANAFQQSSVYKNVKAMPQNFGRKCIFYGLCPPNTFDFYLKQHALRK
jgi:hypothetical protein